MQEPITQTEGQAESAPVHPEEIRASVDLRIGKNVALKTTVRTTPAGLVTAGVMVAAIVLVVRTGQMVPVAGRNIEIASSLRSSQ